jgi:phage terminase large subunit-like protein
MGSTELNNLRDTLSILTELNRRWEQRRFFRLFPEEDTVQPDGSVIHAREKYAKHLEFFAAGAAYRERCFMAGNRCLTPWTYLETPEGPALSAVAWSVEGARVLSWADGSVCDARSEGGFLKGIEQAFRVVLDNGQFFDCSRMHRVLTTEGWLSLDQLVSLSSGLRCWHRRSDYQASCVADGYLGGQPLRSVAGIDLASPLRPVGAQERAPLVFEPTDEVERTLRHIHASQESGRQPSLCDLRRFSDLFSLFAGPSTLQPVLSLSDRSRAVQRLARELAHDLRSAGVFRLGRCAGDAFPDPGPTVFLAGSCMQIASDARRLSSAQWCDAQALGSSVQEWLGDVLHMPIFYPSEHPQLVGGQIIAAIVPLGLQPIIDATVPETKNYWAGGVVHHNTGKTYSAGGYEVSCHLTGLYPEWWKGRRFKRPVRAWAAGKTNETTRDIVQKTLLGDPLTVGGRKRFDGTGVVPGHLIGGVTWKQGVPDLADTVRIRHLPTGGYSVLGIKSYQQGRGSFEGTAQEVIWFDEEPPQDVYGESLIRTATTNGITILTFTPLEGLSEVVLSFLPENMRPADPDSVSEVYE